MKNLGNFLIIFGIGFLLLGLLLKVGLRWKGLGRLPGDIIIRKGNFTLYVPLATGLLLSLVLSLVLFLIFRFFGKD